MTKNPRKRRRFAVIILYNVTVLWVAAACADLGAGTQGEDCAGVACSGHGTCKVVQGEARCLCEPGYTSTALECRPDPCAGKTCHHGHCEAGTCVCDPGFAGLACDDCAPGFFPVGLTCAPLRACDNTSCVHGECRLINQTAVCVCDLGYAGDACDGCAAGYHADGLQCRKNTACDPDPCVHGACAGVGDEAVCACQKGYTGAFCDRCATGYVPDGLFCTPDLTGRCDPNPCTHLNQTICQPQQDSYRCFCDPGYHPELGTCVATTPCNPNPCQEANRTRCALLGDGYVCHCDAGLHDEAGSCVPDTVCDPATTCSGHGTCDGSPCTCATGYAGDHCDECDTGYHATADDCVLTTVCSPNPCNTLYRTVCEPQGEGHTCHCDPGYQDADDNGTCAPNCDTANPSCGGDAHCEIVLGAAACVCDAGFQDNDGNGSCLPTCSQAGLNCGNDEICDDRSGTAKCVSGSKPPIYISFHWQLHQPIYWPYESVNDTEDSGAMGYSVHDIHLARTGPYTTWPKDAVDAGRGQAHLGAQISLSGSLMENLDNMAAAGFGFTGWTNPWNEAATWQTADGNPRLDLVAFAYHHPLFGLLDPIDIRLQIKTHREMLGRHITTTPSKGLFPPECAFSERMIPALVAEGIEWVLVDNIHFDRAHTSYPYVPESNLMRPNPADQIETAATNWVQLNGLWAPSKVSAPWGYQPHWVEHTDPESGDTTRMIAVPAARYEGNEDGRGGYGALQYEAVLSQLEPFNNDPSHPMLVVLHHDGDNYGGGTEAYYHGNFQAFVEWVAGQPSRFVATTIQDYLDRFPPANDDVIHVEDGAWSGADNGDPEFHKWNGDPAADGYSPDRHSWAVVTAAKNRVLTANNIQPYSSASAIIDGTGNDSAKAWHYLLNAETSCYWYWDNAQDGVWDSHPSRAANLAVERANQVLAGGVDTVGPTIYLPQREPYNPGFNDDPSDFVVWTLVYDVSGLQAVTLHWRVDSDGVRDQSNDLYAGGVWSGVSMQSRVLESRTTPEPLFKAEEFSADIAGLSDQLVDYYVSAEDSLGHTTRSPLLHVFVGSGDSTPAELWTPAEPTKNDVITIRWGQPAHLHWGVNGWTAPAEEYWPAGSFLWSDGAAIESPLLGPNGEGHYTIAIGPFDDTPVSEVNFVFHNADDSWSSPDHTIPITP